MTAKKLNTEVPAEGAEYLIQGMLLRAGIPTFKAPEFRSVYDLVSINPFTKKAVTIQVKSRFQSDCNRAFIVNRLGADFFAFVFLNMGNWYKRKPLEGIKEPEYYIYPKAIVEKSVKTGTSWQKFQIKVDTQRSNIYRDAWHIIAKYLNIDIESIVRNNEL